MRRAAAAFTFFLLAVGATSPLAAMSLESVIEGKFVANGLSRIRPENPFERLVCRLVGERLDATRFILSGRCATPGQSGAISIELVVVRPGKQYEMMISAAGARADGYGNSSRYTGVAAGSRIDFMTAFSLEGKRFRSNIRFSLGAKGVERIVETVTAEEDGRKTVLFDLKIARE